MASWPHFTNAPIVETLLDIRTELPSAVTLDHLRSFQQVIKEQYPNVQERQMWSGGIKMKPDGPPVVVEQAGGPDGYLFSSENKHQSVQVRFDGFTFNKRKPYDRWDTFRDEAKSHWERFRGHTSPEKVTRIALRYINRIEIPMPLRDFKDYILTGVEIAPKLPQNINSFFIRLVIPHEASDCVAILTETIEPPTEEICPFIFDIDAYIEGEFEVGSDSIWESFEHLRDFKNQLFFDSITDRAKELFK